MANRIKQLREEYNMTQVRLSIELEVSQETISAYESGKHYPSVADYLKYFMQAVTIFSVCPTFASHTK